MPRRAESQGLQAIAAGGSPVNPVEITQQRGPGGGGRRRRPSGEPPPLPRNLGVSGRVWVALAAVLVAVVGLVLASQALASGFDRWNAAVLRGIVSIRTGWLTTLMVGVNSVLAFRWTAGILRLGTLVALVGLRRWRHLGVFLGCVVVVELSTYQLALLVASPRPMDVKIIGSWEGFSFPSPPVAGLAVTLVGMVYALLPPGRPRSWGKWAAGATLVLFGLARLYLAVDHPTDLLSAVILGVGIPVVAFRFRSEER